MLLRLRSPTIHTDIKECFEEQSMTGTFSRFMGRLPAVSVTTFVLLSILVECSKAQADTGSIAVLIAADRAFAALSEQAGSRRAFLAYLADDAVVFRPQPVRGKTLWRSQRESTARLTWHPTVVGISAAGDLGWTCGPWLYTPEAHLDQPPRFGHYVSVWKKMRGTWKVVANIGITHDVIEQPDTLLVLQPLHHIGARTSAARERRQLLLAERRLTSLAASDGIAAALEACLDGRAIIYRDGYFPFHTRDVALREQAAANERLTLRTTFIALSRSADVAYSYGSYASNERTNTSGYFLRVWRKNGTGGWRVVIDVMTSR